jgi:hypothetical protein
MSPANDNKPSKFVVGQTYSVASICDHNCIYRFTVLSRTDKTVVLSYHGKPTRRRLRIVDGIEACDPHGRYSMSPVLSADD